MQTTDTLRRPAQTSEPDLAEHRRLQREFAGDASARWLLDADAAIRRVAHVVAQMFRA